MATLWNKNRLSTSDVIRNIRNYPSRNNTGYEISLERQVLDCLPTTIITDERQL
jgi:hypothetical protein